MADVPTLFCADVEKTECAKYGPSCCESCHVDADEYGYDLCEVKTPDGRDALVCCWMMNAIGRWANAAEKIPAHA